MPFTHEISGVIIPSSGIVNLFIVSQNVSQDSMACDNETVSKCFSNQESNQESQKKVCKRKSYVCEEKAPVVTSEQGEEFTAF